MTLVYEVCVFSNDTNVSVCVWMVRVMYNKKNNNNPPTMKQKHRLNSADPRRRFLGYKNPSGFLENLQTFSLSPHQHQKPRPRLFKP